MLRLRPADRRLPDRRRGDRGENAEIAKEAAGRQVVVTEPFSAKVSGRFIRIDHAEVFGIGTKLQISHGEQLQRAELAGLSQVNTISALRGEIICRSVAGAPQLLVENSHSLLRSGSGLIEEIMRNSNLIALAAAAVGAIFGVGAASAADLPSGSYTKAPAYSEPSYNWSGFYTGVHGGYGWGQSPTSVTPDPTDAGFIVDPGVGTFAPIPDTSRISGGFGGAQIGYNFQQSAYLVGIEADASYAGWRSSGSATGPFFIGGIFNTAVSTKFNWFGTVRGRLGLLATPGVLLYATGGLAYGDVTTSVTGSNLGAGSCNGSFVYCFSGTTGGVSVGWAAGAGIEYAFAPAWSIKGEYLHIDLGSRSIVLADRFAGGGFEAVQNSFRADTVQVGINYHFH
ncbi:outer membrane protein [Bradyrhizobium erythrophlei]|nr:outer membrane protein [Bradyrhizobium erythrophlei]